MGTRGIVRLGIVFVFLGLMLASLGVADIFTGFMLGAGIATIAGGYPLEENNAKETDSRTGSPGTG